MGNTGIAAKFFPDLREEAFLEAQIATLQADVSHIQKDIANIHIDIRELRGDLKTANDGIVDLTVKTLQIRTEISELRGELKEDIANLRSEMKEDAAKHTGAIRLSMAINTIGQLATAGTILGIVGKALKWF
jgi:predicted  nucleic acid-binding Zn-ribbon protein